MRSRSCPYERARRTRPIGFESLMMRMRSFGYEDPLGALRRIDVVDRNVGHSYQFWLKAGYSIVGVLPDAEGPAMPSITLSKRLSR